MSCKKSLRKGGGPKRRKKFYLDKKGDKIYQNKNRYERCRRKLLLEQAEANDSFFSSKKPKYIEKKIISEGDDNPLQDKLSFYRYIFLFIKNIFYKNKEHQG